MDASSRFESTDAESQHNQSEYVKMIESIERRMDPRSNTVLIVDDERSIRKLVARNIKRGGGEIIVFEASNGREALEQLEEIRDRYERDPLLIVTDLNMPVMDGWEFINALQKDYEDRGLDQGVPVIVLSSTSGEKGLFHRNSVHAGRAGYSPMVSIAKEVCLKPQKYDAVGEKGLSAWINHFLRYASPH